VISGKLVLGFFSSKYIRLFANIQSILYQHPVDAYLCIGAFRPQLTTGLISKKQIKRHERHFGSSVRTCTKLYMILGMVPEQIKLQMAWMIEAWRRLALNGVFSWLCVHMFFRQFPDLINKVSSWHPTMFHFRDTTKLTTGFLLTGRQDKKEDSSGLNKSRHRKTVHSQPNLKMHPCNPLQAVSLTSFTSATSCKLSRRRLSLGTSEDLLNWNTISSFNTNTWYSSHIFSHVNNPSHEASSKKHTAKLYITKHNLESCTEVWLIGSNILHLPCWPKGTMTHLPVMCGSLWGLVFLVVNNPQFLDKEHQDHPIQGAYRLYKSLHHQPQVPSAWRIGVTSESCTLEL